MKIKIFRALVSVVSLFTFASCGQYFQNPQSHRQRSEVEGGHSEVYTATLYALSPNNLGEISGSVTIDINQTDVFSTLSLVEVPHSLVIGQRSISNSSCGEIALLYPPPPIMNSNMEFKEVSEVDNGSREALIAELNQADSHNGDSVNLDGKSYVIKAFIENFNTLRPASGSLVPIACGTLSTM